MISGFRGVNIDTPVSPAKTSALRCKCGAGATMEEEVQAILNRFYLCENCDTQVMLGRYSGIREDALPFFEQSTVLQNTWWHATSRENWHDTLLSNEDIPMVHLGTKQAAISRMMILSRGTSSTGLDWLLYQVRLNPEAKVATHVVDDFNGDTPETVTQAIRNPLFESQGVTRYLNRYEAVGSISLLANPLFFQVESVKVCSISERDMYSMV